jgi:hypothetical protein
MPHKAGYVSNPSYAGWLEEQYEASKKSRGGPYAGKGDPKYLPKTPEEKELARQRWAAREDTAGLSAEQRRMLASLIGPTSGQGGPLEFVKDPSFDPMISKMLGSKARTFSKFALSAKTTRGGATPRTSRQQVGTMRFVIPKPQGRSATVGPRSGYTGLGGI